MRSKILIILIFVISFATAHDLFINHFTPSNNSSITKFTVNIKTVDNINNDSLSKLHYMFHFDGVLASENRPTTFSLFQTIGYKHNFLSQNQQYKPTRPPIV